MISVLYNTNRYGGLDILRNNLVKQSYRDFELIIVDELYNEREEAVREYFSDYDLKYIKPRPKDTQDAWNFNKAMNDGIMACSGALVVVLQDYIWIERDGLKRFWDIYQEMPYALVSGVGNKCKYPDILQHEKGLLSTFDKDYNGTPSGVMECDSRDDGNGDLMESNASQYELNWASFPLSIAYKIGGFDEDADQYYSGDNVQFGYRAEQEGGVVFIDKANKSKGLYHQYWFPRPKDWDNKHFNKQSDALSKYKDNHRLDFI